MVGGCVFAPRYDLEDKGVGEFVELHFLGVDPRCQNSVSLKLTDHLGHWLSTSSGAEGLGLKVADQIRRYIC